MCTVDTHIAIFASHIVTSSYPQFFPVDTHTSQYIPTIRSFSQYVPTILAFYQYVPTILMFSQYLPTILKTYPQFSQCVPTHVGTYWEECGYEKMVWVSTVLQSGYVLGNVGMYWRHVGTFYYPQFRDCG